MVRTALIAFLAIQAAAPQQRWYQITSSESGTVVYLDADRSELVGESPTVWLRYDHSRDRSLSYRSSVVREQIDCAAMRIRHLSITRYRTDGSSFSEYAAGTYADAVPESIGEGVVQYVCALVRALRQRTAQ